MKSNKIKSSNGYVYNSIRELAKFVHLRRSTISRCLKNGVFNHNGVSYCYDDAINIFYLKKDETDTVCFNYNKIKEHRTLVIPDLHAPFIKEGSLEFVASIRDKYKTNKTIFLGDIIDNHFTSYHETIPDGYGAGEELEKAINIVQQWYKEFPIANCLLGNHTALIQRKFVTAGISQRWMKPYNEVLGTPNWIFSEDYEFDGVLYVHGEGRTAINACRDEMQSVVQGHRHSETYIKYFASPKQLCFAMQLGCLIDRKAYSMAYCRHFKKPQLGVGLVLENGRYGVIEPMNMGV